MYVFRRRKKINYSLSLILLVVVFSLFSCKSTGIQGNGISTSEIRDGLSDLERQELEAERNKHELENTSRELDDNIRTTSGILEGIDAVLQQIRKQPIN